MLPMKFILPSQSCLNRVRREIEKNVSINDEKLRREEKI